MALEYRITSYNTDYLRELGKDNWILSTIHNDMMFFYREIKKEVKSRALTTEGNKSISYLRKQREQIDSGEPIHIPEFISNEPEWSKFINHWTQKNSEDGNMHCEKQKTFEIRARWATWSKDKKETKSNTIG